MGKLRRIELSDDPQDALNELADFIDDMELKGCRYPDGSDKGNFSGYWQPISFFNELRGYAHEARRVAGHSST